MKKLVVYLTTILTLLYIVSCSKETKEENSLQQKNKILPIFEEVKASHSNVTFKNFVKEDLYFNFLNYPYVYNGGGVAIGDVNNDGLEDLYFSSNQGANKLYINKGDFVFEDTTKKAGVLDSDGWTTGVSMVDINSDGWLDIYVCKSGSLYKKEARQNKLYINQKDGTFKEQAAYFGLNSPAFSTQAYYLDYDKDGDIDIYLVNHRFDFNNNVAINPIIQNAFQAETTDQLFENIGGKYKEITQQAGIVNKAWGLSASIGDFNDDGWPDIYVANDFLEGDYLYINNQNGTFHNNILTSFDHITANSMGSDFADVNNDLKPDLLVVDMVSSDHKRSKENMAAMSTKSFHTVVNAGYHHQYMSNMLQLNLGNGAYSEIGQLSGIAKTDWSWAPLLADFNNDGFKDLFVTNGILHDLSNQDFRNAMRDNIRNKRKVTLDQAIEMMPSTKIRNELFVNQGGISFEPVAEQWGLEKKTNSNGVAYADLDNDGDLDLVVNNQMELASIYKNNQNKNYVSIHLIGNKKNPSAIGTKVNLYTKNQTQAAEQYVSRGFQSSVSHRLHFGVGDTKEIDSIQVVWNSGKTTVLNSLSANQFLTIKERDAEKNFELKKEKTINPKIIEGKNHGITYKHQESVFDDYQLQLLLPQKQSEKNGALSVADVNNDGKEDFFVGNAKGAPSALYIQQNNGKFIASSTSVFYEDRFFEDNKSLFFDIDNDGDQDLYVTSGSYEDAKDSKWLQDRMYINDGQGGFTRSDKLPKSLSVSTVVVSSDVDNDGDLDVFVGGGVIPGKYPLSYSSRLLENNGGVFTDVTDTLTKGIKGLRMVNDAIFTDYDSDGDQDLIVVGEWMPVTVFKNENGKLIKVESVALENTNGWYFSICSYDIDNDGDQDYVIGNIGENNKFSPTKEKPLHVYANDFDKNNNVDIVLSKEEKGGTLLPVRGKQCSSEQLPLLNKKFKTYKAFADASLSEIYGEKGLKEATHYKAINFSSIILENRGEEGLLWKKLPREAQFGPTLDFEVLDLNNDGNIELLGVGSLYEAEVETIRYDANKGYLIGTDDTRGVYGEFLNYFKGMEVKAIEAIQVGEEKMLLVLCKNETLKLYKGTSL